MHTSDEDALAAAEHRRENLRDLQALPRDGVARRLGQSILDDLESCARRSARPAPSSSRRQNFSRPSKPLPAPRPGSRNLLFAARRMLVEFCGYLAATGAGAQRIRFSFEHHRRDATQLTLSLVAATRDADHLTNVLRERLERTALPCPALAIALTSELLLPLASQNLSFLPDTHHHEEAAAQLIERLRARLGDDAVRGVKRFPDHRRSARGERVRPGAGCGCIRAARGRACCRPAAAASEVAAAPATRTT